MDGICWLYFALVLVGILSFYVFFYKRFTVADGQKVPTIQIDDDDSSFSLKKQQNFANDLLNWILWENSGKNLDMEQQLALSPLLTKFVLTSLNEAAIRIAGKKPMNNIGGLQFEKISRQNDVSESVRLCSSKKQSTTGMFRNFHVYSNETQENNYLSIHTQLSYTHQTSEDGGIRLDIIVCHNNDDGDQNHHRQQTKRTTPLAGNGVETRKVPAVVGPAVERHTVIIDQIIGDVETRLVFIAGELFVISCFRDRPTVRLRMENGECANSDELLFFVKRCVISAVLNFSIGELLYPDNESSNERASRARLSAEYRKLNFANEMYPSQTHTQQKTSPRLMSPTKFPIIAVEKTISVEELATANRLNIQLNEIYGAKFEFNQQPFVCIEMDEPNQRFISMKSDLQSQDYGDGQNRAIWNEHRANFEFTISPASSELLFEVFCEEEAQFKFGSANTIRERKFCGTAIQSLAELRQAIQQHQRQTIELGLQGRPCPAYVEQRKLRASQPQQQQQQKEVYGVLVFNVSFHTFHDQEAAMVPRPAGLYPFEIENGHANQLTQQPKSQSPFAYAGDVDQQQQQFTQLSPIKKRSTTGSESSSTIKRSLSRQKQHYIYNVTDEKCQSPTYDCQEKNRTGSSSSPDAYKTSLSLKQQFEYHQSMNNVTTEQQQLQHLHDNQSSSAQRPIGAVRKTISDTNALFHYDPTKNDIVERKKSAPVTTAMSLLSKQQEKSITKQHPAEVVDHNNNFDHLFDAQKKLSKQQQQQQQHQSYQTSQAKKAHPAMSTFDIPDKMKWLTVGDDPDQFQRMARERDRKSAPKKRERSFFEQVRARLAGPVRLLPGRDGKRAKSYDDNENRPMEEVVASMPTSRDQSQTRQISCQKGINQFEPAYNQRLFVTTAGEWYKMGKISPLLFVNPPPLPFYHFPTMSIFLNPPIKLNMKIS